MTIDQILLTCEHGGNRIPRRYAALFLRHRALLDSHRGIDFGALELSRQLARALRCTLVSSTTSRLLIDLNRSLGHPNLFFAAAAELPAVERKRIVAEHYAPYRDTVEDLVRSWLVERDRVLHLSIHTFTPVLNGQVRNADVGLLYDPARPAESRFCRDWRAALAERAPTLRVRMNYPYRGTSDGLTTRLRRALRTGRYLGVELEVNQKHALGPRRDWARVRQALLESLQAVTDRA